MKEIKWKPLTISVLISLGIGVLSAVFSMGGFEQYKNINKPVLAPPAIVFPIVWTVLFLLMGISAYLVYQRKEKELQKTRKDALILYAVQLAVNFFWPIIFFRMDNYLFAFVWLVILFLLILYMIILFFKVDKLAAILQFPYLLWVVFAGYLNLMIYFIN